MPLDWKAKLQLLASLQPQLDDFKQKYNDSQTELTATKDKLSKTEVDKHLLEIRVTDLNGEITRNNTRITDLEKRPNISSDDWTKDYSQRPSKVELDKVKEERDQRPNISLEDYQKLSGAKSELAKWTTVFPNGDPSDINNQINQSKNDLNDWTGTFKGEIPSQVFNRINYLKNNQEKHTPNELRPADLPGNWKELLNLIPTLQKRPDISVTEEQFKNDYSQRPTKEEFKRVKDERDDLNKVKVEYDDLKLKTLKHKKAVVNKNWLNLTRRLDIVWEDVDKVYQSYGKDLDGLINGNMTFANLNNDNMFKMIEDSVKRVIFYLASQKAEKKSDEAKSDTNLTRGKAGELINWFEKLIDISIYDLDEPKVIDNPFYVEEINKKIAGIKNNNSNQIGFWKNRLEWDKSTRLLQSPSEELIEAIEYQDKK